MEKDSRKPSFWQVIVHTAMGAVLGALLGLALVATNRHLSGLIAHSQSRIFLLALLMGVCSSLIAAGATLSGLIFMTAEMNATPAKRRAVSPPRKRKDSDQ
jgi:NhaP-type Na+/H+ or K+/H+ antiporter